MALWGCSICSSSPGSSLTFPPPHKGCSQAAVPRGHCAVTHSEEMSSEQDPFLLPALFVLSGPPASPFALFLAPRSFISVSIQKLVLGELGLLSGAGWDKIRMLQDLGV